MFPIRTLLRTHVGRRGRAALVSSGATLASPAAAASPLAAAQRRWCSSIQKTEAEVAEEGAGAAAGGQYGDWPDPTLTDLDRSIPIVDVNFVGGLIRTRTARLAKHRKQQQDILDKILAHQNTKSDARKKAETVASLVLQAEESELFTKGVLTAEEWETYTHARPEYDDGYILIDCRTVNEITSWGIIEGAKVLPAHEMFEAFKLTPEDFEIEFGFPKPRPDQKIIFYCQFGPRSLMAAQILSWLGYPNVMHLGQGYFHWAKQYNALLRRWFAHDEVSGNDVQRLATFEAAKQLQREIAPEFNELTMGEAARYHIDDTRSRGTLITGEGLRDRCLKEIEDLSAGITSEDLKLPPSLNERLTELGAANLLPGDERAMQGGNNNSMTSDGIANFFTGKTGVRDERDSVAWRINAQAAIRGKESADDCPAGDFHLEDPIIGQREFDRKK